MAEVISRNSHPVVTAENLKMLSLSAASCQALPIRQEYLRSNKGAVGGKKSERKYLHAPYKSMLNFDRVKKMDCPGSKNLLEILSKNSVKALEDDLKCFQVILLNSRATVSY